MSTLLLSVWIAAAAAQDPTTEPTLAIPIGANTPAPVQPAAAPERPLAIPGDPGAAPQPAAAPGMSSAERLQALRQYRRQRLSINPEVEVSGGGTRVYTGFGWGAPGWGGGMVVTDPVVTTRTWGTYQGSSRLSVPQFLQAAGQSGLSTELNDEIAGNERRSRTFYTVAGIGVAGLLVGTVGARHAVATRNELQYYQFNSMILPSIGLTVGGVFMGSFPAARAERLRRYPSESMSIDSAQQLADEHNDRLRESLGLSPEDVWELEAGEAETR